MFRSVLCASFVLAFGFTSLGVVYADDGTGAAAALGLTAATGKTTLASGAGSAEAALLTSEAFGRAGALIAALVKTKAAGKPVFLLTHDQSLDLAEARYIALRTKGLKDLLADKCPNPNTSQLQGLTSGASGFSVAPKDVGAALATDTAIAPVQLSIDDRVLVTAIAMQAHRAEPYVLPTWQSDSAANIVSSAAVPAHTDGTTFLIPGEMLVIPANSQVMADFVALQTLAAVKRKCAEAQPVLGDIDSFAKAVTTPGDKGAPSQLGTAAVFEAATKGNADILRVAVEQAGGTSITRGNIWYTLGLPGAAVVSGSFLASFRLTDGVTGQTTVAGFVRCAVAPVDLEHVPDALSSSPSKAKRAEVSCSYLAPAEPAPL